MHPFFQGRHYVEAVKKCRFLFLRVLYAAFSSFMQQTHETIFHTHKAPYNRVMSDDNPRYIFCHTFGAVSKSVAESNCPGQTGSSLNVRMIRSVSALPLGLLFPANIFWIPDSAQALKKAVEVGRQPWSRINSGMMTASRIPFGISTSFNGAIWDSPAPKEAFRHLSCRVTPDFNNPVQKLFPDRCNFVTILDMLSAFLGQCDRIQDKLYC